VLANLPHLNPPSSVLSHPLSGSPQAQLTMPSGVTTRITRPYNLLRSTLPTQASNGHASASQETLEPLT
jgi:hypothetical protein